MTALADRVHDILAELRAATGARRAAVVPRDVALPTHGPGLRVMPLGQGARLELELGATHGAEDEVAAALEHAVRALREAAREAGAELPAAHVVAGDAARPARVTERVRAYLEALASLHGGQNALCLVRGAVVAAARPPTELERERADLLVRRTQAAARAGGHTHGELADPDAYVLTFWLEAALVVYFAGPYATDFVRHRARAVARELAVLLPDLEPDPAAPAAALRPPPA